MTDNITDVFLLFLVVELVPFLEVLHQLPLHFVLVEDVEKLTVLVVVDIIHRNSDPFLQLNTIVSLQDLLNG